MLPSLFTDLLTYLCMKYCVMYEIFMYEYCYKKYNVYNHALKQIIKN